MLGNPTKHKAWKNPGKQRDELKSRYAYAPRAERSFRRREIAIFVLFVFCVELWLTRVSQARPRPQALELARVLQSRNRGHHPLSSKITNSLGIGCCRPAHLARREGGSGSTIPRQR